MSLIILTGLPSSRSLTSFKTYVRETESLRRPGLQEDSPPEPYTGRLVLVSLGFQRSLVFFVGSLLRSLQTPNDKIVSPGLQPMFSALNLLPFKEW